METRFLLARQIESLLFHNSPLGLEHGMFWNSRGAQNIYSGPKGQPLPLTNGKRIDDSCCTIGYCTMSITFELPCEVSHPSTRAEGDDWAPIV